VKNYRSWEGENQIYANVTFNLKFNCSLTDDDNGPRETCLDADVWWMDTNFTTDVNGANITANITRMIIRDITVNKCTWGAVNTNFLVELLNILFDPQNSITAMLNAILLETPLTIAT
jgi:hypothetical protein